ncbi:hypothetical protein CFC21_050138, partial [Triticum aestivum]
ITSLFCGDPVKPALLLLGICGTTMFISMWIHNTPCTVMMMPVATEILQRFPGEEAASADASEFRRFSKAVVLGVVYALAIGGMATLTGTAPTSSWCGCGPPTSRRRNPSPSAPGCPSGSPCRSSSSRRSGPRSASCTAPTTPGRRSPLTLTAPISGGSSACL